MQEEPRYIPTDDPPSSFFLPAVAYARSSHFTDALPCVYLLQYKDQRTCGC